MHLEDYPYCCSALVICDFGGGHQREMENFTKQEAIKGIKRAMARGGASLYTAVVTSTQPNAIAAFEELGFYGHPSIEIDKEHRMFPFFLPIKEWDEKAFDARYNPKKDKYKNKKCKNRKAVIKAQRYDW